MHLGIAALAAALAGLLFEAFVLTARSAATGPVTATAAVGGGLLVFAVMAVLLGATAAIAGRLSSPERVAAIVGKPLLVAGAIWRPGAAAGGAAADVGPGAAWGWLAGKAAALGALFGATYAAMAVFHEPIRTAAIAAIAGLPAALLADLAVRAAATGVARLASRMLAPARPAVRVAARRVSGLLLAALVVAPLAWAVAAREELFGAFDPSPIAALALAAAAASAASALAYARRDRGGSGRAAKPHWVIASGVAALVGGAVLLSTSSPARQAVATDGALGEEIQTLLRRVLDMDGDRFAWLLGGDCHPFDPGANPLAVERPGNGYDEDCDGSDRAASRARIRDPLDALTAPPALVRKGGNILVILIDAASRDHLSLYGAARPTTPHLEDFAKECVVFDNFFAASNHTALSMPALLTGQPPSAFPGASKRSFAAVQLSGAQLQKSVQRRLGGSGYRTVMLAGHRMGGFTRGFEALERPKGKDRTPAAELSERLRDTLRGQAAAPEQPDFVVAHFMDAHHPYEAPVAPKRFGDRPTDLYDAELRYVDDNLGPVFDLLREEGFGDWLVVVTSDHGEAFGQHDTRYHGESLYDEEVRVPLLIRAPGVAPRRVATPAGHLDLLPTILEWIGAPRDPALPGRSLLGLAAAAADPPGRRVVFTEFFRKGIQVSVHDGRFALSYNVDADHFERYDRETDPGQRRNLYTSVEDAPLENALRARTAAALARLAAGEQPPAKKPGKHKKAGRGRKRTSGETSAAPIAH